MFVSGARGLRFKSRVGQIGQCCPGAMTRRWGPANSLHARRITASIMRDLIFKDFDLKQYWTLATCTISILLNKHMIPNVNSNNAVVLLIWTK